MISTQLITVQGKQQTITKSSQTLRSALITHAHFVKNHCCNSDSFILQITDSEMNEETAQQKLHDCFHLYCEHLFLKESLTHDVKYGIYSTNTMEIILLITPIDENTTPFSRYITKATYSFRELTHKMSIFEGKPFENPQLLSDLVADFRALSDEDKQLVKNFYALIDSIDGVGTLEKFEGMLAPQAFQSM